MSLEFNREKENKISEKSMILLIVFECYITPENLYLFLDKKYS